MTVRCKFTLTEIHGVNWSKGQRFVFQPIYDSSVPEDRRFCLTTPSGRFEIFVDNPAVQAAYKLGQAYYFDSTEVPTPAAG
jgi:hypothetical protein